MRVKLVIEVTENRLKELFGTEKVPHKAWVEDFFKNILIQFLVNAKIITKEDTNGDKTPTVTENSEAVRGTSLTDLADPKSPGVEAGA